MEIILVDKTVFKAVNLSEYIMGNSQRLEIKIDGNYTVEYLKEYFKLGNIETITIIDENKEQIVIEGYNNLYSIKITYDGENLHTSKCFITLSKKEIE